jgi:hypothetical protein
MSSAIAASVEVGVFPPGWATYSAAREFGIGAVSPSTVKREVRGQLPLYPHDPRACRDRQPRLDRNILFRTLTRNEGARVRWGLIEKDGSELVADNSRTTRSAARSSPDSSTFGVVQSAPTPVAIRPVIAKRPPTTPAFARARANRWYEDHRRERHDRGRFAVARTTSHRQAPGLVHGEPDSAALMLGGKTASFRQFRRGAKGEPTHRSGARWPTSPRGCSAPVHRRSWNTSAGPVRRGMA